MSQPGGEEGDDVGTEDTGGEDVGQAPRERSMSQCWLQMAEKWHPALSVLL